MTSNTLAANSYAQAHEADLYEVQKGPFWVSEGMVKKFGREFLELDVRLEPGKNGWPEKKRYAVVEDDEGLPVMFWRERDGVWTAPCACFV